MTTPTEGNMGLNLIDYDTLKQGGYNDSQIQEAIDGGYAPEIINLMKPTAKKSLAKAPWNQGSGTMTSGVVEGITNSDMILPQRKPRGSMYDDATVFEDLVSGTDIPQNMYNQAAVEGYEDLIMNPENNPNALNWQRIQNDIMNQEENFIPGYNFIDAPNKTSNLKELYQNRKYLNNPYTGFIDNTILSKGNPDASLVNRTKSKLGDFFTGAKEGITSLGGKVKKGGQLVLGPLSYIASMRNPLNPKASNYNPALQGQVDFLKDQGIYGVMDQTGLNKITGGRLKGKALVSLAGTNDIFGMYEKDLEKLEKTLGKLPKQWSKLKKSNPAKYKEKYDALVDKINQNKKEQEWLKTNNIKTGTFPNKTTKDGDGGKGSWGGHGSVEAYDKSQKATYDRAVDRHRGTSKSSNTSSSSSSGGWGPWAKDGGIINIIR